VVTSVLNELSDKNEQQDEDRDLLCVYWSEFLATDPEGLGSIPGASRFSEKQRVWNGVHSASWGQLRSYLEEKVAAPVYKTEINDRRNPLRWPRDTLYPQKLALTSPTSGGRSVGIVRSRTKATEFSFSLVLDDRGEYREQDESTVDPVKYPLHSIEAFDIKKP
jgi:hypothetical protein